MVNKPKHIVHDNLRKPIDKLRVRRQSENELEGIMQNPVGFGYDIISKIILTSATNNSTSVVILNKFDLLTNAFVILIFIGLWGLTAYYFINFEGDFLYSTITTFSFPIIGALITKYSFRIYDKRIMKIYASLLYVEDPN